MESLEWTMPDGSTCYTTPVYDASDGTLYTSVSAIVNDTAFAGRVDLEPQDVEPPDLMSALIEVPVENIYPLCPAEFSTGPVYNAAIHYLKTPSFEWEDLRPGRTFVAAQLLSEAALYERFKLEPHPNIAEYLGCVVRDGRITKLCLRRYEHSLFDYMYSGALTDKDIERLLLQIVSAARHLHKCGYAHNDINLSNVCVDLQGNAVLIDFDSCELIGNEVVKGTRPGEEAGVFLSDPRNDWVSIGELDREMTNYLLGQPSNNKCL